MTANDSRVNTLRQSIEKKRAALKGRSSKFVPVTNCSLELDGQRYNLHTLQQNDLLYLGAKLQALTDGAIKIWHKADGLVIGGYTVAQWLTDVVQRLDTVAVKNEEVQLAKLDAQLKTLLSAEAQTDLAISEIEAMLV